MRIADCNVFAGGEALGVRKLACAFFKCSIYPLNSEQMRHEGGSKLCPLHAFYIWNRASAPAGTCVKLRRRHKFQEGTAERHKVPRAILAYGSLGAPASRPMPFTFFLDLFFCRFLV